MREVYIDSEFKVHTTNANGRTAIETDAFDGMSDVIMECHIFVPHGVSYKKTNGITVHGEFIQPFVTEKEMDAAQREYEKQKLSNCLEALQELGG